MLDLASFEKLLGEGKVSTRVKGDDVVAMADRAYGAARFIARPIFEWPHTRRATFFTYEPGVLPPATHQRAVDPYDIFSPAKSIAETLKDFPVPGPRSIIKNLLSAELWVPEAVGFETMLRDRAGQAATALGVPELAMAANRIGINYMDGTTKKPAEIPLHFDVEEEKGFVGVLVVDGAPEEVGTLTLYACADLCDAATKVAKTENPEAWVRQAYHGATSEEPRITYTFANLQK